MNISFSKTTEQIRQGTKFVTRRTGWKRLKVGQILWACEKCQGLKKGEKIKKIRQIIVREVTEEPVSAIRNYPNDCELEGFPDESPLQFINMFCEFNKIEPSTLIRRIRFDYYGS